MNNIQISDVKKLRELTGYGLSDCKQALIDNNGNFEMSIKQLRQKYASKYENAELSIDDSKVGRIFLSLSECGLKVKFAFIKAKSDSVAQSEELFNLISGSLNETCIDFCSANLDSQNTENAKKIEFFKKSLENLLVYYREPLAVECISAYKAPTNEVIGKYLHNQSSKVLNHTVSAQKGAIIAISSSKILDDSEKSKLKDLADLIAMSMIGNENANVLYKEELKHEDIENFRNKSIAELSSSGKPDNVIEKIVDGQMKKFFEASTLILSPVINPGKLEWLYKSPSEKREEISIEKAIEKASEILKTKISIPYYRIFRIIQ
jgi:elongation factor Ts